MSVDHRTLLEQLADGEFHSGEHLARSAGVSRTAIWKHLQTLAEIFGLELHSVRGKGYRLVRAIELLERERIAHHIADEHTATLAALDIFESLPSTSAYLTENQERWQAEPRVCFAEHQTAGRGRRGRRWVSPFGSNLYFSLFWPFDLPLNALGGLSLASGVAVARALERIGLGNVALKWPNDLQYEERKLGGLLVEGFGPTQGPVSVVIGVGINFDMPDGPSEFIDQPWIDLKRAAPGLKAGRNQLAGVLVNELLTMAGTFGEEGWSAFRADWERYDGYRGRQVEVRKSTTETQRGIYRGVDDSGGLVLETEGLRRVFHSGEVSLRAASDDRR